MISSGSYKSKKFDDDDDDILLLLLFLFLSECFPAPIQIKRDGVGWWMVERL